MKERCAAPPPKFGGCLNDLKVFKVVKDFKDPNNPPYLSFPHS